MTTATDRRLLHLAIRAEWDAAREAGEPYRRSTRGASLDEVGFIHLSYPHQLATVANAIYADCPDPLCVLVLDPAALTSSVIEEDVAGQLFPHCYGPIDLAAVAA